MNYLDYACNQPMRDGEEMRDFFEGGKNMKDYKALEKVLNDEFFTNSITINHIKPMHDEDFGEADMICVENIMVIRADASLASIVEALKEHFSRR